MSYDLTNKTISATFQNLLQRTGSDDQLYDLLGNAIGNLKINGSLTANEYIVSSSVTYLTSSQVSGSSNFGDDVGDVHTFTGSLRISGSGNAMVDILGISNHEQPLVKIRNSGSSGEFLHMINHDGYPAIQFNQGGHGQCSWHMYGSGSYGGSTPVLCHQFQDASTGGDSFVNNSGGNSTTNYFGVNTSDPSDTLTVNGDISASNGIYVKSPPHKMGAQSINYGSGSQITGSLITDKGNGYGDIVKIGNTGTVAGRVYCLGDSSVWSNTDADGGCVSSSLLGVAMGTNSGVHGMLLRGFCQVSQSGTSIPGQKIYASKSPGTVSGSAPVGSGDVVRILGYALNAGNANASASVYFNPSNNWITRT